MADKLFAGGTVVTAEGSFRADVAVDGRDDRGGRARPPARRRRGDRRLRRPRDAGLHRRPHAPRHAVRRHDDRRRLEHRQRRRARGRDDDDRRLLAPERRRHADRRGRGVAGQGGVGPDGLRPARRDHEPDRGRQARAAVAAGARRRDREDLHGLQGHAALHRGRRPVRGDADRARVRAARAGPRRERRRDREAAGAGARARRHVAEAGTGSRGRRPSRPRRPTARSGSPRSPTARCSSSTSPAPPSLEEIKRAHARGRPVYAETCPQYLVFSDEHLALPDFEGAKYVLSPPLRDASNQPALWNGLQRQDLHIFGSDHCSFNFRGQKELGKDDFTLIPNGAPGLEERAAVLWTHGVREGRVSGEPDGRRPRPRTRRRCTGWRARRASIAAGADADLVDLGPGPDDHRDAGQPPRQRRLHALRGHDVPPARRRGSTCAARSPTATARCSPQPGTGQFVHRTFAQPAPGPAIR